MSEEEIQSLASRNVKIAIPLSAFTKPNAFENLSSALIATFSCFLHWYCTSSLVEDEEPFASAEAWKCDIIIKVKLPKLAEQAAGVA